jgi:putative ABC transport system substrate-binding protein
MPDLPSHRSTDRHSAQDTVSPGTAASYLDRILRGETLADLPLQPPFRYDLVLNLKTVKAIGLEVSVNVLALADEVTE